MIKVTRSNERLLGSKGDHGKEKSDFLKKTERTSRIEDRYIRRPLQKKGTNFFLEK